MADMMAGEVAQWLNNEDGYGADDVAFAECMVKLSKLMFEDGNPEAELTKKDMLEFDSAKFANHIKKMLDEIIFDEDVVGYAWWKQN